MATMVEERPLFQNQEWCVTEEGLEHRRTGYFIDRTEFGQRRDDDLWAWPLHMAEKSWCAMAPFAEAFARAAALYGVRTDAALTQSFEVAQSEIAPWPAAGSRPNTDPHRPVFPPVDPLQNSPQIPISIKPERAMPPLPVPGRKAPIQQDIWRPRPSSRGYGSLPGGAYRAQHPAAAQPWRKPTGIRKAGNRLVEMLQAALTVR